MHSALACSRAASDPIALGTVIGRKYRIDEVVAEGGMGIVYRGWHLVLELPIAIKVVRPEYVNHVDVVSLFVTEARANAQLRGLHVAHVLDMGRVENGPPFMVLEYLDGRDLRAVLTAEGPLSIWRAADYLVQACDGVAEAHARGIVHRDLKPENLFLARTPDRGEVLKVIDFGISKAPAYSKRNSQLRNEGLGSPHYMAPEQISSPENVDGRSDVWSLGVVLFELLTNDTPFRGETVESTCVQVLYHEPGSVRALRPDIPEGLDEIIARCLKKRPDERFQSVRELAAALEPYLSEPEIVVEDEWFLEDDAKRDEQPVPVRTMTVPSIRARRRIDTDELRVPVKPLWPAALTLVGVATVLALATRADPDVVKQTVATAVDGVGVAASASARTLSAFSASAAEFVGRHIAERGERPSGEVGPH
ncbi:MAG: protein kinase [Polyangiaceae bacterium]